MGPAPVAMDFRCHLGIGGDMAGLTGYSFYMSADRFIVMSGR